LRGDVVLVAGQGPIGLMFTRLLELQGARVIATDLLGPRLKLARRFGARWAWRGDDPDLPGQVERVTRGRGLDAAVVAVPSDAVVRQTQAWLRGGGQLLLFAHTRRGVPVEMDLAAVCVDEKDLLGSYSSDFTLQDEVARLVFARRLDTRPLITHRFPLERTADAVRLAAQPTPESLKAVVSQV
jgi:L-iditol 2-dehydrogenase